MLMYARKTHFDDIRILMSSNHTTCSTTDSASTTKIPDAMNNGKNIPVTAAIEASAPPMAKDPVSPMNIDAL